MTAIPGIIRPNNGLNDFLPEVSAHFPTCALQNELCRVFAQPGTLRPLRIGFFALNRLFAKSPRIPEMTTYAYLRVSRDTQDVANQRLGVLDYANANNLAPVTLLEETISRAMPWREKKIGNLLTNVAQPGDVLLTSEFTRLGASPTQVFSILGAAAERGITVIVTKTRTTMDGSLNSQIQAMAFSIASMIELEFIRARTKEGLQRAKLEGRIGGRRKGSTGRLKLDASHADINELFTLGVTIPKLAARFKVTEKTMRRFVNRRLLSSTGTNITSRNI